MIAQSATDTAAREEALIERARHGDTVAFERLLEPRLDGLLRTAWAIVGNEADARDALQEACVSAWQRLPTLRDADHFDAWLGRVAINACRMLLRTRSRVREIAIADGFDAEGPRSARADGFAETDAVERAFERLDPSARALLVLHHLQHQPLVRIASTLGIPVGTVKWRLHAARRALQQALEGEAR